MRNYTFDSPIIKAVMVEACLCHVASAVILHNVQPDPGGADVTVLSCSRRGCPRWPWVPQGINIGSMVPGDRLGILLLPPPLLQVTHLPHGIGPFRTPESMSGGAEFRP